MLQLTCPRTGSSSQTLRAGFMALAVLLTGAALVGSDRPAWALDNGVARTPPMGWDDWNSFGCNVSETLVRQVADAIVANGMAALGYQYVIVDDCWFEPTRDAAGNLRGSATRFPSGMKALGDYIHGKGLKFGIYEVPTDRTCAQRVGTYPGTTGSQGHEAQDARTFASWGVDYLKYDWCSSSGTISQQVTAFATMRNALAATGRPIVLSINPNSFHAITGPSRNWGDVANQWRTTEDITTAWDTGNANSFPMGVRNIVNINAPLAANAAPGRFNDPDMLEVGNGGMTDTEMRTHFTMWAFMAAPLIAGNDLRSASAATLAILNNQAIIAIDQDGLGLQGVQIVNDGTRRVLAKRLSNGDVAVALFNQGSSTTTVSTTAAALGKSGSSFSLRDLWTSATSSTTGTISASVPAHGTVAFRLSGGSTTAGSSLVSAASSRCFDDPMSSTANGTQPIIWDCSGAPNQRWTISGNTIRMFGKCLDAPPGAVAGDAAILLDCSGGTNQAWTFNLDGSVQGVDSGLCLDVTGNNTANATLVGLWTCNGAGNQRWTRE
jgi:alpha-galactosidase